MDVPVAANVLGTVGAVCWSIQLLPQILINYRRHHAAGLQPTMMMLWAWAGVPLGVYNVVEGFNIALRIQPQILTALSLITWIQCLHYERNWSISRSVLIVLPIAMLMGGVQASLIVGLRLAKQRQIEWPATAMAVMAASLLAMGVLRHYWDIWIYRTVRGISFIFVGIDAAGDLFSLLSIVFQPTSDTLGMVIYGTELFLWLGVFACGGYFNLIPWIRSKRSGSQSVASESQAHRSADEPIVGYLPASQSIALHNFPSSTSVFRTPSSEMAAVISRTCRRTPSEIGRPIPRCRPDVLPDGE